jgi:hypothetical protein
VAEEKDEDEAEREVVVSRRIVSVDRIFMLEVYMPGVYGALV